MVKRIHREAEIPGVDVTELCKWLKDPEMYVRYHEEYNNNKRITISDWKVAQNVAEREVIFLMPLQAPSILKKTIGTDVVRVHDQHRVTAELEDGAPEDTDMETLPPLQSVIFESKPAIAPKGQQDMPFAKVKFLFTNMATPTGQCACKVSVDIACTAEAFPWLWALHSIIEKVMGAQCKRTADGLIEYWQRECRLKEERAKIAGKEDGMDAISQGEEKTAILEETSPTAAVEADDVLSTASSVYYDAEEGSQTPHAQQHPSKKGHSRWRYIFCCLGVCKKQHKESNETHLLH
ncbi:g9561 [Coccomyxa elongata]